MKPESILVAITEQIYKARTATEAKTIMVDYLLTTTVSDRDSMIKGVTKLNSLIKVQRYFTNCLLKFEGLSLNK